MAGTWRRRSLAVPNGPRATGLKATAPATPTLDQALALDRAFMDAGGGYAPILDSFQRQIDLSEDPRSALSDDIAATSREAGEAIAHCIQALQPGATPAMRPTPV